MTYGCHSTRRPDPTPGSRLPAWARQEPVCSYAETEHGKADGNCAGCADRQRALGLEPGGDP